MVVMPRYVKSRFSVRIPLSRNRSLAYNSMTGAFALWDATDGDRFEQVDGATDLEPADPVTAELVHGGYIVPEGTDEVGILERQYRAHRYDPHAMILTIAPTLACNFGCDYCFQGQSRSSPPMNDRVQDAVVAMVERVAPHIKRLHVAWYGGEPLLKRSIIESLSDRLIALCDRTRTHYDAMMVTNGYRLDHGAAQSLNVRRVRQIQVTLDGMPHDHDQRRALLSGKGTFDRIIANLLSWIDEVPIAASLRVNVDERNGGRIHELIDLLTELGLGGKERLSVYFAPIEAITEGCFAIADVAMGKAEYARLEAGLNRHALEAGLAPVPYPPRFRGSCAAVRPRGFVIVPNGDIHKCWDTVSWPEKRVGTIFDVDALNREETVLRWLRWSPFELQACRNCKILPVCAGACAYKFIHADDTRGEAAMLPCPSWRYNIAERLLLHAEHRGVITRADHVAASQQETPQPISPVSSVGGSTSPLPPITFRPAEARPS